LDAFTFDGPILSQTPTLDAIASAAWFNEKISIEASNHHPLIQEVGERLIEHAQWIKLDPQHWMQWRASAAGERTFELLRARFRKAQAHHWESTPRLWQEVQARRNAGSLLGPMRAWLKSQFTPVQVLSGPLNPNTMDLIVSNLTLHQEAQPEHILSAWAQALRPQGVVLFSALGPDTLKELHELYQEQGWGTPSHPLIDMHDWGDMLVHSGFSDPVVDMERLQLTYSEAKTFIQDLRGLGRNLNPNRFGALKGRDFLAQLLKGLEKRAAGPTARFSMTFEVIYAHAFKAQPKSKSKKSNEFTLDLQSVRSQLQNSRRSR
jgi:malonyl-CoA O-methyltransferase